MCTQFPAIEQIISDPVENKTHYFISQAQKIITFKIIFISRGLNVQSSHFNVEDYVILIAGFKDSFMKVRLTPTYAFFCIYNQRPQNKLD